MKNYSFVAKIMVIAGLSIAASGAYVLKKPEEVEFYKNKIKDAYKDLKSRFSKKPEQVSV